MEFKSVSEINEHLIVLTKNERKITYEILQYINLFESCNGPIKMGYASTFQYLVRHLGYSDDQAFRRIKAAKLLKQVPEVAQSFQNGQLNLSQAANTQKAFAQSQKENKQEVPIEKKKDILNQIENKNNFNTQKVIAEALNLTPSSSDLAKPQSDKTIQIQTQFTAEQYQKLETLKSLVSHIVPHQKLADVLEIAMDYYLEKKGNLKKSNSTVVTSELNLSSTEQRLMETRRHCNKKRKHISLSLKRAIFKRSNGCCEYITSNGIQCQSRYKLHIDHITPVALGGSNEFQNLRVLCEKHNSLAATQMSIGIETTF